MARLRRCCCGPATSHWRRASRLTPRCWPRVLAQEEFFYRALADRIGAPFHVGGAPLDPAVSPAHAINAGFVYLAKLGAPYRAIAAPRGDALRLLVEAADAGRPIEGLAITSPRRLGALVRVERANEIASRAANALARLDPALSAKGEIRPTQTLALVGFGLALIALAFAAPGAERALTSVNAVDAVLGGDCAAHWRRDRRQCRDPAAAARRRRAPALHGGGGDAPRGSRRSPSWSPR